MFLAQLMASVLRKGGDELEQQQQQSSVSVQKQQVTEQQVAMVEQQVSIVDLQKDDVGCAKDEDAAMEQVEHSISTCATSVGWKINTFAGECWASPFGLSGLVENPSL